MSEYASLIVSYCVSGLSFHYKTETSRIIRHLLVVTQFFSFNRNSVRITSNHNERNCNEMQDFDIFKPQAISMDFNFGFFFQSMSMNLRMYFVYRQFKGVFWPPVESC